MQFQYLLRKAVACRFAIALAVATAPFWPLGSTPVHAECLPAAVGVGDPAAGTTVVCTGTTNNGNVAAGYAAGYGTGEQDGLTINVVTGATVTGDDVGIDVRNNNVINNAGTIAGPTPSGIGIQAISIVPGAPITLTINNAATGTITGDLFGIFAFNPDGNATANVLNYGTITVTANGFAAIFADIANVTNFGTITSPAGSIAYGINAGIAGTIVNYGTINAGSRGIVVGERGAGISTIVNAASGSIVADAYRSIGIHVAGGSTATISNSGLIQANGDTGTGIKIEGTATVTNSGTITANGPNGFAVFVCACGNLTLINSGLIRADGDSGVAVFSENVLTVINSGTITADGNPGTGIGSGAIVADTGSTLTLVNSGTITANGDSGIAVYSDGVANITNSGTIKADGPDGVAIRSDSNATLTLVNSGTIQANGDRGIGVNVTAGGTANIVNTGTITANGTNGAGIASEPLSTLTVVNLGTINADGNGAAGIAMGGDGTVTNAGTITALGTGGVGIAAQDNAALPGAANIVNSGSITVTDGTGIGTGDFQFVLNTGAISGGAGATGILVRNDSRIDNYGTVSLMAGGTGVQLFGDRNTLNNFGTIVVTGGVGVSIDGADTIINNAGLIRATGAGSNALLTCACGVAAVTNTGTIDGQIFLGTGSAVTNSGLITITDTDANNPVGVAHIVGETFVQTATGTLALRVTSDGRNDSLATASISGVLTLAGTLRALVQPGLYANSTTYNTTPAVTSGPVVTTTFDRFVSSSPFFTVTPIYDNGAGDPANWTALALQLDRIAFGSVPGLTPNQRAVGNALEGSYSPTTLTGNAALFYSNLLAATSVTVLDQISGEGISAAQNAAFTAGALFSGAMLTQGLFASGLGGLGVVIPPAQYAPAAARIAPGHEAFASLDKTAALAQQPGRYRVWTAGFGATQSLQGQADVGSASQSVHSAGGVLGFDWQATTDLRIGAAVGGSESTFSAASLSTSGRMTGGHVGVYGMKTWGAYYIAASLSYARFDNSTTRTITGIGATETLSGRFDSDLLGGRVEVGWRQPYGRFNVTPFVAVEPSVVWQRGFTESSSGVFGLTVASQTVTSLPTFVGVQVDGRYRTPEGAVFAPYSRVSWVHEFEPDRRLSAAFVTVPGASFTVNGARAASDAARLDTGAKLTFSGGLALFANFTGEWSDRTHSYAGTGGFRYAW